jgi:ankyrin repeat protein
MKQKLCLTAFLLLVSSGLALAATNDLADLVRKGLFDEEANHNLDAAVQSYQSAIAGFDQDRQLAATAIFRLGECYRKLGRTNEAAAQYARILREFPDQSQLADLSRSYVPQNQNSFPASEDSEMSPDERKELQRVQQLARSSPDLIGESAFVNAAGNGWAHVVQFLLSAGTDPNHRDRLGWLPLCKAAEAGHEEVLEILLAHGADVNGRNSDGKTALSCAATEGHLAIARTLLEHHADMTLEHRENNTEMGPGPTPLHAAARGFDPRMVELLLSNGANVNIPNYDGESPLFEAVEHGRLEATQILVAHGANVNLPNKSAGATPLFFASQYNDPSIMNILLTNGANVNVTNVDGETPLFAAIWRKNGPAVELLLDHGADVNVVSHNGNTPLAIADTPELKSLFVAHGADKNYWRLNEIFITRGGSGSPGTAFFQRGHDADSGHSLTEAIGRQYGLYWERGIADGYPTIPFPDFKHVVIHHFTNDHDTPFAVDFSKFLDSGDCWQDTALQWGDIVEINQLDHKVNESWNFPASYMAPIVKCLTRNVQFVVQGKTNELSLQPEMHDRWSGASEQIWRPNAIKSRDLNYVVRDSNLLLLSSDLARVQVIRGSEPPREFNLETQPPPQFILRDGDIIEIPEK